VPGWQARVYGEYVREAVRCQRYEVSRHAEGGSRESGLSLGDVEHALLGGEIVESHPEGRRGPSHLIGGHALDGRPVGAMVQLLPAGWVRVAAVYVPVPESGRVANER